MPPHTRTASLLILITGKPATTLTLLVLRDVHGPTQLLRVSPLAPPAHLIIRDVLQEITITGNHAWKPITLAYQDVPSVPRQCHLSLAVLARRSTTIANRSPKMTRFNAQKMRDIAIWVATGISTLSLWPLAPPALPTTKDAFLTIPWTGNLA